METTSVLYHNSPFFWLQYIWITCTCIKHSCENAKIFFPNSPLPIFFFGGENNQTFIIPIVCIDSFYKHVIWNWFMGSELYPITSTNSSPTPFSPIQKSISKCNSECIRGITLNSLSSTIFKINCLWTLVLYCSNRRLQSIGLFRSCSRELLS